jgi:hypothetical protein
MMEILMPVLKSLTFTAVPTRVDDPILIRRTKLVGRLEEQRTLLQNPSYSRTVQRTIEEGGEKRRVDKQQRVRPWWRNDTAGNIVMSVYYGAKPIEFEKGKAGIAVASKEKLPSLIETLITAVRNGELDEVLKAVSKPKTARARKAA